MRILIALIVGGAVMMYFGIQEIRLRSAASDEPQQITCADLAANGPGDNAHIVLGDFLLCEFSFVYEEKNGKWNTIWVPAVPLGGEYHQKLLTLIDDNGRFTADPPMPTGVKVIVKTSKVSSESELSDLGAKDTLQGVVVNKIESLGSEEKKILKDSYPAVDFDQCWILEEGRNPATALKMYGLTGGGAAMIVVAGVIILAGRKQEA